MPCWVGVEPTKFVPVPQSVWACRSAAGSGERPGRGSLARRPARSLARGRHGHRPHRPHRFLATPAPAAMSRTRDRALRIGREGGPVLKRQGPPADGMVMAFLGVGDPWLAWATMLVVGAAIGTACWLVLRVV